MKTRVVTVLSALLLCAVATGCTQEKARSLRLAAEQFKVESLAAIDGIETMLDRELEPVPRMQADADAEFVSNLLQLNGTGIELTDDVVDLAIDPYPVVLEEDVLDLRRTITEDARKYYSQFASIFDDIEQGSYFAGDAVEQTAPFAQKLTLQMVSFAESISSNPPRLIQHRSAISVDMDAVVASSDSDEEKRAALLTLKERWLNLKAEEDALARSVIEQCLKAAVLGRDVSRAIEKYNQVSLDDIDDFLTMAIR